MKPDDPILNIQFVKEIRNNECLWNSTISKRNAPDKVWEKISRKFNEPVPILRDRWRNIKTAFHASEKLQLQHTTNGIKPKRPYYLSKYLQFLVNAKNGNNNNNNWIGNNQTIITQYDDIESNQNTFDIPSDNEEMINENYLNDNTINEPIINYDIINEPIQNNDTIYNEQKSLPIDINNKVILDESYQSCSSYTKNYHQQHQSRKRKRRRNIISDVDTAIIDLAKNLKRNNNNDTNLLFLQSILPDMKKLTDQQNRSFRIKVLTMLDEFLIKNE